MDRDESPLMYLLDLKIHEYHEYPEIARCTGTYGGLRMGKACVDCRRLEGTGRRLIIATPFFMACTGPGN